MVIKIDEQLNAHLKDNLFVLIGMRKLVYQIREKEDHRSAGFPPQADVYFRRIANPAERQV